MPKDFHKWCGICEAKMVNLLKSISEHVEQKEQHSYYEIRITSFGLEDLEPKYKKSFSYLIGIKKK